MSEPGSSDPQNQTRFDALMTAGEEAFAKGQLRTAHDLWRQAAALNPYAEAVWLALLRVIEEDEDRRVCLQNVIAINPLNVQARRQLRGYELRMERYTERLRQRSETQELLRAQMLDRRRVQVRRVLLTLFLLAVALGGLYLLTQLR